VLLLFSSLLPYSITEEEEQEQMSPYVTETAASLANLLEL
jgi:hypothetical protein